MWQLKFVSIGPLAIAVIAVAPALVMAQGGLPMGTPVEGSARDGAPAVYTFLAETAGVLSVAVEGSADLAIVLVDSDGQVLPDGTSDRDLNGSLGTELLSATITEAGTYGVRVRVLSGESSTFRIAASFLSFPAFEKPADPDGRPSRAQALEVGAPHEDELDSNAGDDFDWFVFTATEAGTLAIITRSVGDEDVDLMITVFHDGDFENQIDSSDQDQEGNTSNEAVTVAVTQGQRVFVKVSGAFDFVEGPYRISSSLIR